MWLTHDGARAAMMGPDRQPYKRRTYLTHDGALDTMMHPYGP
jgi:hypothetical protein